MGFDWIPAEDLRGYAQMGEDADDEKIGRYRDTAMDYIERYTGRKLERMERTERYPARRCVLLNAWPVESVAQVETGAGVIPEDEYELDAEKGILTMARAEDGGFVSVTYTGGYTESTLPGAILAACAMIVSGLISAGANGGQQITYQALDGYQVTYSSKYTNGESLEMLSPSAAILLRPFRGRQAMR